jgi:hypothetical protein
MRATLALAVVLAAAAVAGCGGSSDETVSVGGNAITVPGDVHGVYGELEALLDQFPYQRWYTKCVVARVKKDVTPVEAESLSESKGETKAVQVIAKAGPACERSTGRPSIDPNASSGELDLLRAEYVPSMTALAETHGLDPAQVECVEHGFENLPDQGVIAMGNGSRKVREGILLSVFKPCAQAK